MGIYQAKMRFSRPDVGQVCPTYDHDSRQAKSDSPDG
jgi:hypothetical protein